MQRPALPFLNLYMHFSWQKAAGATEEAQGSEEKTLVCGHSMQVV